MIRQALKAPFHLCRCQASAVIELGLG
jgi:hypothetical protein